MGYFIKKLKPDNMQNLYNDLTKLLETDERVFADGKVLKNKVTELAIKLDSPLLNLIVDLKLSSPKDEKIVTYQSQLWAYAYAFGHSAKGDPKKVTRTGLLIFYPDTVEFSKGSASLTFPPTWFEVPINQDSFLQFMYEVNGLLEGPTPPENPNCKWCAYRHFGEKRTHLQTDDIPF